MLLSKIIHLSIGFQRVTLAKIWVKPLYKKGETISEGVSPSLSIDSQDIRMQIWGGETLPTKNFRKNNGCNLDIAKLHINKHKDHNIKFR